MSYSVTMGSDTVSTDVDFCLLWEISKQNIPEWDKSTLTYMYIVSHIY